MKHIKLLLIALAGIVLFAACGPEDEPTSYNVFTDANLPEGQFMISVIPNEDNRVVLAGAAQQVIIDWGDGTSDTSSELGIQEYEHRYATGGEKIIVGKSTRLEFLFNNRYNKVGGEAVGVWSLLNVSGLYNLRWLSCTRDTLTNLNVTLNPALEYLQCESNRLTNLDVSKNKALKELWCEYNPLINLDVSNNLYLNVLLCSGCRLTDLDFSRNALLEGVRCDANQLTQLKLGNNPVLWFIDCGSNLMTAPVLDSLFTSLPIKTNEDWGQVHIYDNPGTTGCSEVIAVGKCWHVVDRPPTYLSISPYKNRLQKSLTKERMFAPKPYKP